MINKIHYVGQSQTFVATVATLLPPRHQTATLVYSNPQQLGTNVTGPRLAVASPMTTQRQVRPIQISSARLPTAGLSRVSTATGCKLQSNSVFIFRLEFDYILSPHY